MNINRTNNLSFNGVYRIKNTPANIEVLKKTIIPTYEYIRQSPISFFIGSNPFSEAFINIGIEEVAKRENYCTQWVTQNAKQNGVNLDTMNETIYVITGEKDHEALIDYMVNVFQSLDMKDIGILKTFKLYYQECKNLRQAILQNLPKHLLPLAKSIADNESQTKHFYDNFVKNRNVKDYSNPMELLNAVMAGL